VSGSSFDERNGWRLYQHPAFRKPFDALTTEVERLGSTLATDEFRRHPKTKLLARIVRLILDEIPLDPGAAQYELGNTLGSAHRHWKRAKFLERFRLFFRYRSREKIIVYGWINDEHTLRAGGAKSDPYAVFERRLKSGDPPDDWGDLLEQSG
jgi:toxin YhaV